MLSEKPWQIEAVLSLCLALLLCMLFGAVVASLLKGAAGSVPDSRAEFIPFVISTISFHGAIIALVHFFLRYHRFGWAEAFGFNSSRQALAVVLAFGTAIAAFLIARYLQNLSAIVMTWFRIEPVAQKAVTTLQTGVDPGSRIYYAFMAVALAPVAEELLFRGILYPTFKRTLSRAHFAGTAHWLRYRLYPRLRERGSYRLAIWLRGWVCPSLKRGCACRAVLVTSLIFGAVHFNLVSFLPLVVLAVALTCLYEATDNLLAPILAHGLFNMFNFLLLLRELPAMY